MCKKTKSKKVITNNCNKELKEKMMKDDNNKEGAST